MRQTFAHRARHVASQSRRGQTMVELALVFPLFIMLLAGIVILGIGLFYQQQVTNAAREAARYASIHSATSPRPTVSWLDPVLGIQPLTYNRWDRPEDSWPDMTAAARRLIFGVAPTDVNVAACWSGYRLNDGLGQPTGAYDAPPPNTYDTLGVIDSSWAQCQISGVDPTANPTGIPCTSTLAAGTTDQASSLSEGPGRVVANTVTAYACYEWSPPLAGFLLIPQTVTLRAVITEPIERQQ